MATNDLNGFPPGYFLIRAINSDYYGKRMLLDVARSERRPGVELVLWVDEAQSVWHTMKHQHEDSQIFFMSDDGLLRSKVSGHPVSWQLDKAGTPRLVVQPPRPFNYNPQPHCQFTYDKDSRAITTKLPYDLQPPNQSFDRQLKRQGTDVSQASIAISITSADESIPPSSPGEERNYLLEVVPRVHRQSRIVQFFDSVLESPSEEPEQPPASPSTPRREDSRNDSWYKGRDLKLIRERRRRHSQVQGQIHADKLQQWEIIPLSCSSCDATSEAWAIQ